jgi:hypothetical protein
MTTLLNAECRTQNEDTRKERYMEMEFTEYERTILDYANTAAGRLLLLTQSENEEFAIRSCVEVLKLANQIEEMKRAKQDKKEEPCPLPPELASKWLDELANYQGSQAGYELGHP